MNNETYYRKVSVKNIIRKMIDGYYAGTTAFLPVTFEVTRHTISSITFPEGKTYKNEDTQPYIDDLFFYEPFAQVSQPNVSDAPSLEEIHKQADDDAIEFYNWINATVFAFNKDISNEASSKKKMKINFERTLFEGLSTKNKYQLFLKQKEDHK